jgi:hypothetical protein
VTAAASPGPAICARGCRGPFWLVEQLGLRGEAAAAVREGRSSLRRMLLTCRWTVCPLTTSRAAICRFVSPSAKARFLIANPGDASGEEHPYAGLLPDELERAGVEVLAFLAH